VFQYGGNVKKLSVVSIAIVALFLVVSPRVFATPITINFSCAGSGNGVLNSSSTCPLVETALTQYTEYGFTVTPSTGKTDWTPKDGHLAPMIETGTEFSGSGSTHITNTVKIAPTAGSGIGGLEFDSIDLSNNDRNIGPKTSNETYTIAGYDTANSNPIWQFGCTTPSTCVAVNPGSWITINAPSNDSDVYVNYVLITVTDPSNSDSSAVDKIDNIELTPSPEPSSLLLLGSGMLGLAGVLRRKFSRA